MSDLELAHKRYLAAYELYRTPGILVSYADLVVKQALDAYLQAVNDSRQILFCTDVLQ